VNFYPHHIGDYLTATAHLSWLEDAAYRRLLDVYYSRESAIPADVAQAARLVRAASKDERKAVDTVLREFFTETPEGWKHKRCDAEIVKAAEAAERARTNGKKGGRPPTSKPTTNPEETQSVISGNPEKSKSQAPITNPITNTNKPPKPPRGELEGFEEFYAAYPRKEDRAKAVKAFAKVTAPLAELLAALEWQCKSSNWRKDGGQFIPLPASWLNGERWKDEKPTMPQPGDAPAWFETRQGVERKACALGIGVWVELEEQYPTYRARVMTAAKEQAKSIGFNLDQLAAMAAQRSGVAA
jgi:uncharacterized protein YdaU (DUF1376 family)